MKRRTRTTMLPTTKMRKDEKLSKNWYMMLRMPTTQKKKTLAREYLRDNTHNNPGSGAPTLRRNAITSGALRSMARLRRESPVSLQGGA